MFLLSAQELWEITHFLPAVANGDAKNKMADAKKKSWLLGTSQKSLQKHWRQGCNFVLKTIKFQSYLLKERDTADGIKFPKHTKIFFHL